MHLLMSQDLDSVFLLGKEFLHYECAQLQVCRSLVHAELKNMPLYLPTGLFDGHVLIQS